MIEILEPYFDKNILNKIIYPINIQDQVYEFYIQYNISEKLDLNTNIDAIVIMFISVAICNKWKIKSNFPIDEKLYHNLLQIPNTYKKYHSKHTSLLSMIKYNEIDLILDLPTCNRSNSNKGLQCNITPISMGIDSLHTILLNKDHLTHLIYVNEMDRSSIIDNFQNSIKYVSNKYNKTLIIADSNFKDLMTWSLLIKDTNISIPGTNFAVFTSDAILFASCYPLGIKTMYFSGNGYKIIPYMVGQHHEINKYYISNEFNCNENHTPRINKINFIMNNDKELIKDMRVCNENNFIYNSIQYLNCSKCRKCYLTILYFYMLGYYDELKHIFLLPDKNEINIHLYSISNDKNKLLSSIYHDKIYDEYFKMYKNNNFNSIKDIVDNYTGEFIYENYVLTCKN